MTSQLIFKALDIYADIFQRYEIQIIPVHWDKTQRQFVHISNTRKLLFYYFSLLLLPSYLITFVITLISNFQSIPVNKIFTSVMFCSFMVIGITFYCVVSIWGTMIANGMNELFKLERVLRPGKLT